MVVAVLLTAACGKSEAEKQAEQAAADLQKAAEAATQAAQQQGAAGAADMTKAMQGMAAALSGAGADGKPVEPIAFQTLQSHLPKVPGWEMSEPEGERMTMPVPFSQIEADYRKGEANVDVKIVDTGFAQMLVAPWSMMLATGYSRETSDGYEKATTVYSRGTLLVGAAPLDGRETCRDVDPCRRIGSKGFQKFHRFQGFGSIPVWSTNLRLYQGPATQP